MVIKLGIGLSYILIVHNIGDSAPGNCCSIGLHYTMGSINYHLHGPLSFHSMWIGLVIDNLMCVIWTSIGEVRDELVLMMVDSEVQWYSNWALDCHIYILYTSLVIELL